MAASGQKRGRPLSPAAVARARERAAVVRYARRLGEERGRPYTLAYARRLRRGVARGGGSVAAIRGHGPGEHRTRAAGAIAAGRLTERQRAWTAAMAPRLGIPPAQVRAQFAAIPHGQRELIMQAQQLERRQYLAASRRDSYQRRTEAGLRDDVASRWRSSGLDVGATDLRWYYYH